MLNIVVLNGGRGAASVISAFLSISGNCLTSVVNAYDDGKSTGAIRRFFEMLGPSDIRKVQELMLPERDPDRADHLSLFEFRYPTDASREAVLLSLDHFAAGQSFELAGIDFSGKRVRAALQKLTLAFLRGLRLCETAIGELFSFSDCSIMNCLYAGAFLSFDRNIETAARYIEQLFRLTGTVLPSSIEDKKLVALRENGEMLYCEADIVELRSSVRIERIYLLDNYLNRPRFEALSVSEKRSFLECMHSFVGVSDGVKRAVDQADIVVYSSGTQHSSLYPTYLSKGLAAAIADNKRALKVFITNIGADYETPMYKASDFVRGAYHYLNTSDKRRYTLAELFDAVLVNDSSVVTDSSYVEYDSDRFADLPLRLIVDCFESADAAGKHDGQKVVETILALYEEKFAL